ncbi:TIR domain-containing protein [Flavobacterium arcticum]|uniref:TIR domain-containing protein n=1 Tax=Flavobacterium arcticum TaxID=1784713 RepID=A0A345HES7_9FLAO|nr:TIR domain-containing protein [Flavobacterium arcticum]AXG75087.1 TIR domain-containing protein [Flavobacterium arcticum]KAF2511134.1 TIR domain-containing protein [Flavobacterium arcticum]
MNLKRKIELLKKVLTGANEITKESSEAPEFRSWKSLTERTLIKIFGKNSHEVREFNDLDFFYDAMIYYSDEDYSRDDLIEFRKDLQIAKNLINSYIEEFEEELIEDIGDELEESNTEIIEKNFISHSSMDKYIVEELIEIIEVLGIDSDKIFCSSFPGYGIPLGENFLDKIKQELSENSLILFVLSKKFYNSPVSLCEMGATWALSKQHIPIIVPPFNYKEMKGVIPLTQGFIINSSDELNLFKEKIETFFDVKNISFNVWERKRDRIINRINKNIT